MEYYLRLKTLLSTHAIIQKTVAIALVGAVLITGQPVAAAEAKIATSPLVPWIMSSASADRSDQETRIKHDPRADQVRAYFEQWDLPAADYAESFVKYADEYDLDWRLVASLAMLESTGFKNACGYNGFGWGSCRISFKSYDEAIRTVTMNLAGHNPNTARYYKDKSVHEILNVYNPPATPGITPGYHKKAIKIMDEISSIDLSDAHEHLAAKK